MSLESIDKLRESLDERCKGGCVPLSQTRELWKLIDAVEAEVEDFAARKVLGAISNDVASGVEWVSMPADELAESYVKLPTDADGVPIHVDDLLRLHNGKTTAVRFITFNEAGWLINDAGWLPDRTTHYQPDTWEQIIKDAIREGMERQRDNYEQTGERCDSIGNADLVARCKKLAGDDA